jgi:hypothetical protein
MGSENRLRGGYEAQAADDGGWFIMMNVGDSAHLCSDTSQAPKLTITPCFHFSTTTDPAQRRIYML